MILLGVGLLFTGLTIFDWWRHGGGLIPKRKAWLVVAAFMLGMGVYLRVGA